MIKVILIILTAWKMTMEWVNLKAIILEIPLEYL